ncbi:MAG: hypothetical protein AAF624_06685 [Bacteroidota bacterium]
MLVFRSLVVVLIASLLTGPATALLCPHGTAVEAVAMDAVAMDAVAMDAVAMDAVAMDAGAHETPPEAHEHAAVPPCHRAPAPEAPPGAAQHLAEAPLPDAPDGEVCLMPCCDATWATATPDVRLDGTAVAVVLAWLPTSRVQSAARPVPSPTGSPPPLRRHVVFCQYLI